MWGAVGLGVFGEGLADVYLLDWLAGLGIPKYEF